MKTFEVEVEGNATFEGAVYPSVEDVVTFFSARGVSVFDEFVEIEEDGLRLSFDFSLGDVDTESEWDAQADGENEADEYLGAFAARFNLRLLSRWVYAEAHEVADFDAGGEE